MRELESGQAARVTVRGDVPFLLASPFPLLPLCVLPLGVGLCGAQGKKVILGNQRNLSKATRFQPDVSGVSSLRGASA